MAKVGSNPDFKLEHPDWVRDAQTNNYIALTKKVRELAVKKQETYLRRRLRMVGKN